MNSCPPFRLILAQMFLCFAGWGMGAEEAGEKILLWPDQAPIGEGKFAKSDASLTVFRPAKSNGTAIIICPGGGYGGLVTGAEGTGIARWLNGHGITGIVLEYRLPQGNHHLPLLDAQRALRIVRSRQGEAAKLGIMGFSAGGHLASTAATHFDEGQPTASDPLDKFSSRPDFAILVYPVISMGALGHGGSRQNLLGANPTDALKTRYSNELQVTAQTPPCFLTHALDDQAVSAQHSQLFADALKKHGVPCEYLVLPTGGHGLNGYQGPMWDAWQRDSLQWLVKQKLLPAP